jgi:hypothetical protein
MRKTALTIILSVLLLGAGLSQLEAREFGLGIIVGEPPAALSLKLWPSGFVALDAAFSWSSDHGHSYVRLHGDLLFHSRLRLRPETGRLSFYYGLGARYLQKGEQVGLRVPLGLSYMFDRVPLEAFIEFVPTLDLTPDTEFLPKLAGGVRFYLF